jgi:hypothetical protein
MDYNEWLKANDRQPCRASWADYAAATWGWLRDFAEAQFDLFKRGIRDGRLHDNSIELADAFCVLA